jgi:hypothetical protein
MARSKVNGPSRNNVEDLAVELLDEGWREIKRGV